MTWLRGKLGGLRLRLFGPGEILPREQAEALGITVPATVGVMPLISCTHRWPNGSSAWGPCYRYGGENTYYSTCQRCGVTARC